MTYESKRNWILPEAEVDSLLTSEEIIQNLLKDRGVTKDQVTAFLNPNVESIPDYANLHDSVSAAKVLLGYIKEGKKIIIHGDFDADGICATTILWEFLYRDLSAHLGLEIDVLPYIPKRKEHGYGLSEGSVGEMIENSAEVVITVDCGIRDKEIIKKYQEKGLHFIITDHHQPPNDITDDLNYPIVHPMFPDHNYPEENISGGFVALLFVQAIMAEAGLSSEFTKDFVGLDLAALSTVTDMMPLTGVNRTVVALGLQQIAEANRLGLDTLIKVSGITRADIKAYHFGFVLGPRINASGRIGDPLESVRLLSTSNSKQAQSISLQLDTLNKQRQQLTEELIADAESQVDPDSKIIIAYGKDWPEGIVGLVAGKLMEKYSLPVLVISELEDKYKGSARSLGGFNITKALDEVSDLLIKHGGHSQAAGFSIAKDKFDAFTKSLYEIAQRDIDPSKMIQELKIDSYLTTDNANLDLLQQLMKLEPFGYGNKRPLFLLKDAVIIEKKTMGKLKNHMKMSVRAGGLGDVSALLFNCEEDIENLKQDDVIDIVGNLDINEWNGRVNIQFMVKEWRRPK